MSKPINKPADLWIPAWFPAVMRLICACNGCEDCQEELEKDRYFPIVIPGLSEAKDPKRGI